MSSVITTAHPIQDGTDVGALDVLPLDGGCMGDKVEADLLLADILPLEKLFFPDCLFTDWLLPNAIVYDNVRSTSCQGNGVAAPVVISNSRQGSGNEL